MLGLLHIGLQLATEGADSLSNLKSPSRCHDMSCSKSVEHALRHDWRVLPRKIVALTGSFPMKHQHFNSILKLIQNSSTCSFTNLYQSHSNSPQNDRSSKNRLETHGVSTL